MGSGARKSGSGIQSCPQQLRDLGKKNLTQCSSLMEASVLLGCCENWEVVDRAGTQGVGYIISVTIASVPRGDCHKEKKVKS